MAPASKPGFRVEAVLPAPAQSYFLERDSAAFRSLLSKVLKIGQLEFNDLWREGNSSFVRMITKPEFGSWVPKSVANQLSSGQLEFHDIIEYNPAHIASPPYKIFVRTESPFLKDKLDVQMTLTIEELEGGSSCRQVLEGHIRVRMFGVGRIVEGIVKDSLQNTYKKLPEIVRRWQLFREEALRSGDGQQLLLGRPPVGCEVGWIRQGVMSILQEPLPDDGTVTPVSALCPVPGASEASNDSPDAVVRAVQHQKGRQQQGSQVKLADTQQATAGVEMPAAEGQQQAGQVEQREEEPVGAAQLLQARRVAASGPSYTRYYDASEDLLEAEGSARLHGTAAPAAQPGGEAAEAEDEPRRQGLAALAAAMLARGAHHRRGISDASAASTDTPTAGEEGVGGRQPLSRRFWRRFNRDYGEWDDYWTKAGVEAEDEEGRPEARGVVARAVHAAEEMLRGSYYSTSILIALFLMRNGWVRVAPDTHADTHDEAARNHAHHRHAHVPSSSSSSRGGSGPSHLGGHGVVTDAAAASPPQSLARVAQEVRSRMVSGSRAVAQAPVRAVQAAGASVRQASLTGAKAWADLFARPPRPLSEGGSADGSSQRAGAAATAAPPADPAQPPAADAVFAAAGPADGGRRRQALHRKTMSLDTGTAVAAQQAAADAAAMQAQQQQPGVVSALRLSPSKDLQRRPSNMAALAEMASSERMQHRVRTPGGRYRLACFTICRRPPAVKD